MQITPKELAALLRGVAEIWQENRDRLTEIDSKYGDGDHGVTIGKLSGLLLRELESWDQTGMKAFIEELSAGIMGIGGGSAGPLYGTLVEGLAEPLEEDTQSIDGALLQQMLVGSREALFEITKARTGDKTMMDALIPGVEAAQKTQGDILSILTAASAAAWEGAESTREMVSKFGRARSYGEQTLGTPDAGAVSTALFFKGLLRGAEVVFQAD